MNLFCSGEKLEKGEELNFFLFPAYLVLILEEQLQSLLGHQNCGATRQWVDHICIIES